MQCGHSPQSGCATVGLRPGDWDRRLLAASCHQRQWRALHPLPPPPRRGRGRRRLAREARLGFPPVGRHDGEVGAVWNRRGWGFGRCSCSSPAAAPASPAATRRQLGPELAGPLDEQTRGAAEGGAGRPKWLLVWRVLSSACSPAGN